MTDVTPALLDVPETAAYLRLSRARVYELVNEGLMTAHKIGGKTVFKRSELERFIRELPEAPIKRKAA